MYRWKVWYVKGLCLALPHVVIPVNPIAKDLIMCKEHTAHATVWQKEDMEASFTKIITLTEGMDEKLSLITWCPNTLKQKARSLVFTHLWSIWNETDLCQEKSPSRRWGFNLNEWWVIRHLVRGFYISVSRIMACMMTKRIQELEVLLPQPSIRHPHLV